MSNNMQRYVKVNNWIFEVKMVRAIRVDDFGNPYSAIANLNINGDNLYIDGLMTNQNQDFTREDYQTFINICQQLDIKNANFDRYKNQQLRMNTVNIEALSSLSA